MKVKKIPNNNVIIAVNEMNMEYVLTGKGVGFDKKVGDIVDFDKVEKVFTTQQKGVADKLSKLIENIPIEYVKAIDEIINMAKKHLQEELNENIYLTLIDHITFAIERHKGGFDINSLLKWEIRKIAPEEYEVGLKALDILEKRLDVRLPEDEAIYIAFHFINSRLKDNEFTENSIDFTRRIVKIIKDNFDIKTDEESMSYGRFVVHLQYLARRIFKGEETQQSGDESNPLYEKLRTELQENYFCVCEMENMIKQEYDFTLSENEKTYLMIHLNKLVSM